MSKKELYRGEIISKVISCEITQIKASEQMGISLRQTKRLCKRYRKGGLANLAHRNRGKPSNKKMNPNTQAGMLELIKNNYPDFGPQLIKEQLEERHDLIVSREWIRSLMIKEGLWKVKKRKNSCFYQRRNRRPREGELIQIDGSPEYWFEDRGPKCCLINMVDDATSKIMEFRFIEEECLEGYFQGMKRYIETHGRPLALYSDRHTIFKSPKAEERPKLTQFGKAMKELDIELIYANSPQAKGRVERIHGTLQDRLIKLMRLEGISSIEEGNKYLESYREEYNHRFGRVAQSSENAHRELAKGTDIDKVLCRKEERKISKSLEIQYKHKTYQLIPKGNGRKLAGKTAMITEHVDGIRIEFDGEEYDYTLFGDQPYFEHVMDRKKVDAFLDRKKPLSIIQRHRMGMVVNF
ncbi:MAG: ISNCY family transposase [Nanoarchaeota archaeon]|nr:ISNCY family transposase [Nanoarchaeota archaeon]